MDFRELFDKNHLKRFCNIDLEEIKCNSSLVPYIDTFCAKACVAQSIVIVALDNANITELPIKTNAFTDEIPILTLDEINSILNTHFTENDEATVSICEYTITIQTDKATARLYQLPSSEEIYDQDVEYNEYQECNY